MDWDFGIGRCKFLHSEWINNKVLMYSTGNYIQYSVMKHNGTEDKKKRVLKKIMKVIIHRLHPVYRFAHKF